MHVTYDCPKEHKVPVEKLEWLRSQWLKVGERAGMQMAEVYQISTKKVWQTYEKQCSCSWSWREKGKKYDEEQLDLQERIKAEQLELELE